MISYQNTLVFTASSILSTTPWFNLIIFSLKKQGVESSLERGVFLPEEDFEIQGDETLGVHFGPARSRTSASSLLHGYSIKVQGQNRSITEGDVYSSYLYIISAYCN